MYLNELNLIFSFSRWRILAIVMASNTTELIDANMIVGVLYLVSAFGGIRVCGTNGTKMIHEQISFLREGHCFIRKSL